MSVANVVVVIHGKLMFMTNIIQEKAERIRPISGSKNRK